VSLGGLSAEVLLNAVPSLSCCYLTDCPDQSCKACMQCTPRLQRWVPWKAHGHLSSVQIGLLSAPTPFLTGRPHTLIHGKDIHSTGTVGIALRNQFRTEVNFGLKPLTSDFTIATYVSHLCPWLTCSAQGNLLLSIEEGSGNPTQTLMAAIQKRDAGSLSNKDEEFFLRIGDRMIKILSGDPSRGALSLDMEDPLRAGQPVQASG